jgi:cobalt-zinc-cadmium efflux system outer membrane protein
MNFLAEQLRPGQSQQDAQYTVNVGQPIELGGKRQRRIDSARAATQVTTYQLDDARRQVVLQVKSAFAAALIAREQLALAEANLNTLDDTERIDAMAPVGRFQHGEGVRAHRTFAREAADARQALAAARIALRTAAGA